MMTTKKLAHFQDSRDFCATLWLRTYTKTWHWMDKKNSLKNCATFRVSFIFTVTQQGRYFTISRMLRMPTTAVAFTFARIVKM